MAETPSRRATFARRTVEVGDGDYDEISNEDITCKVDIQNIAHVRTGTWIHPRQH